MTNLRILACAVIVAVIGSVECGGFNRGCYYTNWAQYRPAPYQYTAATYVPGTCSHLFYAFAIMSKDDTYQVVNFEWNDDTMFKTFREIRDTRQKDLKLIISFGGWNFCQVNNGGSGLANLTRMASSPENRQRFIQSAVEFVRRNDFDGFDIDWEYPSASDRPYFNLFVKELREALDAESAQSGKRLLLTAAVAAEPIKIKNNYDGTELAKYLDYFNVMSYDYHGAWENKTGFSSPLFDFKGDTWSVSDGVIAWLNSGVPKSKLMVGLSTYGRGWILKDANNFGVGAPSAILKPPGFSYPGWDGIPVTKVEGIAKPSDNLTYIREFGVSTYFEGCILKKTRQFKEYYDEKQQSAYIVGASKDFPGETMWIGLDNMKAIVTKLDWIIKEGFAGGFLWALDYDDFTGTSCDEGQRPILTVMNSKLGGAQLPSNPQQPNLPSSPPQSPTGPTQTFQGCTCTCPVAPSQSPLVPQQKPQAPQQTPKPPQAPQQAPNNPPQQTPPPQPAPTARPTQPSPAKLTTPSKCVDGKLYSNPDDCGTYFHCANGVMWKKPCQPGLHFNGENACDYPDRAKCQSG